MHTQTSKQIGIEVMSNLFHTIQSNFADRYIIAIVSELFVPIAELIQGEGGIFILLSGRKLQV